MVTKIKSITSKKIIKNKLPLYPSAIDIWNYCKKATDEITLVNIHNTELMLIKGGVYKYCVKKYLEPKVNFYYVEHGEPERKYEYVVPNKLRYHFKIGINSAFCHCNTLEGIKLYCKVYGQQIYLESDEI